MEKWLLIFILLCGLASAQIIPEDRMIDWSKTGVPGGIPNRETICSTLDPGSTATDINNAINSCNNGVVYLNPGTYSISGTISFVQNSNVTLRGAGPDNTILLSTANTGITFGEGLGRSLPNQVISGAQKGSTEIFLDTASLIPGMIIRISQDNDPNLVFMTDCVDVNAPSCVNVMGQLIFVESVNSDSIEFSPPLVWSFTNNPTLFEISPITKFSGIEDLTLDGTNGNMYDGIIFGSTYGCWIKNVHLKNINNYVIHMYYSLQSEIRDSLFDDTKTYGSNHGGVVTWLEWEDQIGTTTLNKIENNIFYKMFPSVELAFGAYGNYVGYNYAYLGETGQGMCGVDLDDNHKASPMMNLYEGNVVGMIASDGYFGSSSYGTIFRNNIITGCPNYGSNQRGIYLSHWSYNYNIVGNVFGTSPYAPEPFSEGVSPYLYEASGSDYESWNNPRAFYVLGYPNMGNPSYSGISINGAPSGNDQTLDLKVNKTTLRWGNYDPYHDSVIWNINEIPADVETPNTQNLPPSLVYSSKPDWFGNVPWPPIGPDVSPRVNKIPAQYRFEGDYSYITDSECDDNLDNDGDGNIDLSDDGCIDTSDNDESNCGDGTCEGAENCTTCAADCGECLIDCVHEADQEPCDGCIDTAELSDYVALWKAGSVEIDELMEAIGLWKAGC